MGANTKIEWATHTFNPWLGCQKVSPGCDNCYAEDMMDKRYGRVQWGPHGERKRTSEANWKKPLQWARAAMKSGTRPRVFCASLADVFDNQVPVEWRADLWRLIASTPELDWLVLTKRPDNMAKMLPFDWARATGGSPWPWSHVWLGVTAENQDAADRRVPILLATSASIRFVSYEPALGPVDFTAIPFSDGDPRHKLDALTGQALLYGEGVDGHPDLRVRMEKPIKPCLDWIIAGGESGPNARSAHPDWFRSVRDQCAARPGVAFLFKQWGEWAPAPEIIDARGSSFHQFDDGAWSQHVGKKRAGRLLDGVTHDGFPA